MPHGPDNNLYIIFHVTVHSPRVRFDACRLNWKSANSSRPVQSYQPVMCKFPKWLHNLGTAATL